MVILLTGVGTRQLNRLLATRYPENAFAAALGRVTVVARGPKPVAALRDMGLTPAIVAPEPNTWRELLRGDRRPARAPHCGAGVWAARRRTRWTALRARGAEVTRSASTSGTCRKMSSRCAKRRAAWPRAASTSCCSPPRFRWRTWRASRGELGIEDAALENLRKCQVCSIGPTTTEALEEFGVHPAMEPSHPKMGFLVKEAAERVRQ